jgi:hypothetical protein
MAAATLTYDYSASTAWLAAPETEPHPMNHDLCGRRLTSIDARLAS